MKKDEFGLKDFVGESRNIHVKIDIGFLKKLLIIASKSDKPHWDPILIKRLKMKCTKNLNCCMTIYGWIKGYRTIPLSKLAKIVKITKTSWAEVESKIVFIRCGQNGGEINPRFPIKIDQRIGSVVGHIMGDGSIDSKWQQISFSNSNKELLKEFASNMEYLFGVKPRIWMQKAPDFGNTSWDKRIEDIEELLEGRNCSLFYPTTCSIILNKIFNNFAIGRNKAITQEIMNTTKEFKASLIRAFYDDEGNVNKSSYIRVFQDKKEILESFKILLSDFGISSSNIFGYIKRNKERYYFNIHRKTNFIKFQKEIGFTSSKKASNLSYLATIRNKKNSL